MTEPTNPPDGVGDGPGLDDDLDDLAGLPDDEPDDGGDDEGDNADDCAQLYAGVCSGGPYDGMRLASRFPSGVLLVDTADGWAVVYDLAATTFTARARQPLDDAGCWRAAEGDTYDVRAYDPEFTGDTDDDGDDPGGELPGGELPGEGGVA